MSTTEPATSSETKLAHGELVALDRELVRLARGGSAWRLQLGETLDRMSQHGLHHELGFSSLTAYALERCGKAAHFTRDTVALARKLRELPILRTSLIHGTLGWSMVELVARHATPETEAVLALEATSSTVRQMRERLAERGNAEGKPASAAEISGARDDMCTLTVTVDHDEAWLLAFTNWLFCRVERNANADTFIQGLLGEGLTALLELIPRGKLDEPLTRSEAAEAQAVAWRNQRAAWCREAEARCEGQVDLMPVPLEAGDKPSSICACGAENAHGSAYANESDAVSSDELVQRISQELARRDLLLGALAERFFRANGWRRLGYATETQYLLERLGISLACMKTKRALSRRSQRMPSVGRAIERGEIGLEAALLVTRIALPGTIDAWLERAARRTVKLLREEVEAAELRIRLGGARKQLPPDDSALEALAAARLETNRLLSATSAPSQMSGTGAGQHASTRDASGSEPLAVRAHALLSQMSGTERIRVPRHEAAIGSDRAFGRVRLRFRVTEDQRAAWHGFEEIFAKVRGFLPAGMTLVSFVCGMFYLEWGHLLDPSCAYGHIYARDGFVCRNPTCCRRDLTPHHLEFRAAGGTDEDENLVSLCVWCHLAGIHEGRIKAEPPASNVRWELGRTPILVVEGREKIAA